MKIKRLGVFISSLVLSLASLMIFTSSGIVLAAGNNCTWNGGTSGNFNSAGNWTSCGGTVPQNGDNLVFDNTTLTGDATVTDDLVGLSVGTITFQGTNVSGFNFTITGATALSVAGGITDTSNNATSDQISLDLTLTADQSFTDTAGAFGLVIGNSSFTNILDLGSHTLTLNSNTSTGGSITINSQLQGTGPLVMNGDSSGVYNFEAAASSYSGTVTIDNGQAFLADPAGFGTGTVTVANGGSLNTQFVSATPTFSNALSLGGNGFDASSGVLIVNDGCPAPGNSGSCTDTGTDTFSGVITLTSNATVGSAGDNVNFTGTFTCNNFTLTQATGSSGTLTGVPTGCDGSTTGGGTGTTPTAPNTGTGILNSDAALPFFGSLTAAAGLYLIALKIKKVTR